MEFGHAFIAACIWQMLAEVTRHAEERERALTELVAHLEEVGGGIEIEQVDGQGYGPLPS